MSRLNIKVNETGFGERSYVPDPTCSNSTNGPRSPMRQKRKRKKKKKRCMCGAWGVGRGAWAGEESSKTNTYVREICKGYTAGRMINKRDIKVAVGAVMYPGENNPIANFQ